MTIPGKVLIAILSACIVSFVATLVVPASNFVLLALVAGSAALLAVLASHKPLSPPAAIAEAPQPAAKSPAGPADSGPKARPPADKSRGRSKPTASTVPRETGTVKWFNGSKGFGFIIRDNGEEIFVHYRSIRGEGRRSLRDGQSVSFQVEQTDKGPQAEDVEGLN
jgi:cold shock CspA family protein